MRTRRGTTAVEFGLVITVLLALLLGMVDWSLYMVRWLDVGMAVGRGARIAAGLAGDPETAAAEAVCESLSLRRIPCAVGDVEIRRESDSSGQVLVVRFELPFDAPVGFVPTPPMVSREASTAWYGHLYED